MQSTHDHKHIRSSHSQHTCETRSQLFDIHSSTNTIHSQYIQHTSKPHSTMTLPCTAHSRTAYDTHTQHAQDAFIVHSTNNMHSIAQSAHTCNMHSRYIPNTFKMHSTHIQNRFDTNSMHIQHAIRIQSKHIHTTFVIHSQYTRTVSDTTLNLFSPYMRNTRHTFNI